jgi:hypothetical protein
MTTSIEPRTGLYSAMAATGRSPEIPETADLYGWLVGSWELDVVYYRVDVAGRGLTGEVHCGWVLEGRALQDVWIMPARADRDGYHDTQMNMYGTTLRVWDPSIEAWRITYMNPMTGQVDRLIGRGIGRDIVQIGSHADGTPSRWTFTEITQNSFHWTGESLMADGRTWKLGAEFRARRIN